MPDEPLKRPRSPKQLANDERLRGRVQMRSEDFAGARTESEISATGPATRTYSQIEVIPAAKMAKKAADAAFMNEVVTILIEPNDDPDAAVWVHSGNGGIDQYIQRGVPQPIRRIFLYSLIAAKKTGQASAFGKDGSGKEFNRLTGRTSTTHRISLLEDTPEGRKKFAEWMQMPA